MAIQLSASGDRLTPSQVDELEVTLRTKLPDEYKDFLRRLNVAIPEENVYRAGSIMTSVTLFFGVSKDRNRDLVTQNQVVYADRLPSRAVAIAAAGGGNLICLRTSDGGVYFWDHEREAVGDEEPTYANMTRLAPSFADFLDRLDQYRADNFSGAEPKVKSVKLKPGFQEKFKKYS